MDIHISLKCTVGSFLLTLILTCPLHLIHFHPASSKNISEHTLSITVCLCCVCVMFPSIFVYFYPAFVWLSCEWLHHVCCQIDRHGFLISVLPVCLFSWVVVPWALSATEDPSVIRSANETKHRGSDFTDYVTPATCFRTWAAVNAHIPAVAICRICITNS